jgi:hypothetical protein
VVDLWSDCNKPAELSASCLGLIFISLVSIFDPTSAGELKGQHWQSPLYQCNATYSGMSLSFPEASLKTHYPCVIHPIGTDKGKPHLTPWCWGCLS